MKFLKNNDNEKGKHSPFDDCIDGVWEKNRKTPVDWCFPLFRKGQWHSAL